jgi:hypothetical protein
MMVRETHPDNFNARNVATALQQTSTLRNSIDGDDIEAFRVLSRAVARVAHTMSPKGLIESMTIILNGHCSAGGDVDVQSIDGDDAAAIRVLSECIARVAHRMPAQPVIDAMSTLANVAGMGLEGVPAALRAVNIAATRVSGDLTSDSEPRVSALWRAWGKMAWAGIDVDHAAVRATGIRVMDAAPGMSPGGVASAVHALGHLVESPVLVDDTVVRALTDAVTRVSPEFIDTWFVSSVLSGLARIAESGVDVDPTVGSNG